MSLMNKDIEFSCVGRGRAVVTGSFRPTLAPAAGIDPGSGKGCGWTVARAGVGLYTITFRNFGMALDSFVAGMRAQTAVAFAVGRAVNVAAGTAQIQVYSTGAGTPRGKSIQMDISSARLPAKTERIDLMSHGAVQVGSTPPTLNEDSLGGWAFDATAESVHFSFLIPEDWAGNSDLTLRVVWNSLHGNVIALNETVDWTATMHSNTVGAIIDAAGPVVANTQFVGGAAEGDEQIYNTDITIDYNNAGFGAGAGITKGDRIYVTLNAPVAGAQGTYQAAGGDVILRGLELLYTAAMKPLQFIDSASVAAAAIEPYLTRTAVGAAIAYQIVWPATCVTPVQLPTITYPPDHDGGVNMTLSLMGYMSGANDTPTVGVASQDGVNAVVNDVTTAFGAALAEETATLALADFGTHPNNLDILLTPAAHANDALYILGASLEYQSTEAPDAFAVADLAAHADNEIDFIAIFRDTSVDNPAHS